MRTMEALAKGKIGDKYTFLDLRTGQRTEQVLVPGELYNWIDDIIPYNGRDRFIPLNEGILLIVHHESKLPGATSIVLVEVPSYRQIIKVPYATQPREPTRFINGYPFSSDYDLRISDDRKILVYSFDHVLACRRTDDLKILWTRQVEQGVTAFNVVASASRSHVAAAISDTGLWYEQHKYYISIFDGKTGADLARLPLSGTEGTALSPDGRFIAVVAQEYGGKRYLPTVYIYEVSSGKRMASIIHDRVKTSNDRALLLAACAVRFTSDGKYLITSGMNNKVWKLDVTP